MKKALYLSLVAVLGAASVDMACGMAGATEQTTEGTEQAAKQTPGETFEEVLKKAGTPSKIGIKKVQSWFTGDGVIGRERITRKSLGEENINLQLMTEALKVSPPHLTNLRIELDLEGSIIVSILKALEGNKEVTSLSFENGDMNEEVKKALLELLKVKTVKALCFDLSKVNKSTNSDGHKDSKAVAAILDALRSNTTVTSLGIINSKKGDIRNVAIGGQIMNALWKLLRTNKNINKLDLRNNHFYSEGNGTDLVRMFDIGADKHYITLRTVQDATSGTTTLKKEIGCSAIKELNLQGCSVTSDGTIVELLENVGYDLKHPEETGIKLKKLNIKGLNIEGKDVKELPGLEVIY
ncbi:MAG: hypothetical protein K6C34_03825 [Alphaproteobacteria bacterium]|nr:hypothetical protein [Alphaproteobacteria bacterium]